MKHGGNIYQFARENDCLPEQVIDFSANINPYQAVDWRQLTNVNLTAYAEPDYSALKQALAARYSYPVETDIEVFNGASAAIYALLRYLQPKDLVLYTPLYGEYAQIGRALDCTIHTIDRFSAIDSEVPQGSTVIFVNPSTPDGQLYALDQLLALWRQRECTVLIDESFLDFCQAKSAMTQLAADERLYVIKSLSKFYGCAGIRVGFIAANRAAIAALRCYEPAWKLSTLDMAYIQAALANQDFAATTLAQTAQWRAHLHQVLQESGLFTTIYPGRANFLLTRLAVADGYQLQAYLRPSRLLIRVCENFTGLTAQHVRFAVKHEAAMMQLAHALSGFAA